MKKILLGVAMLLGMASYSQVSSDGTSVKSVKTVRTVEYNASTKTYNLDAGTGRGGDKTPPTSAGKSAVYHGETYPVYISSKGKEFILVTSKKTGNQYRKYIN